MVGAFYKIRFSAKSILGSMEKGNTGKTYDPRIMTLITQLQIKKINISSNIFSKVTEV